MKKQFSIVEYNPNWPLEFEIEKKNLELVFGDLVLSINHVGSTAIKSTMAKPEIDILVVLKNDSNITTYDQRISELGYTVRGECLDNGGTKGRYYYSKDQNNVRTHKLHVCRQGHPEILRFLLFKKFLNDHHQYGIEYASIKTSLSKTYNYEKNIIKYLEGKSKFIMKIIELSKEENFDMILKYG